LSSPEYGPSSIIAIPEGAKCGDGGKPINEALLDIYLGKK
jgi:hypothetical protein